MKSLNEIRSLEPHEKHGRTFSDPREFGRKCKVALDEFNRLKQEYRDKLKYFRFKFVDSVRILGHCDHADNYIAISNKAVDFMEDLEIIDVVRHEVAHALVGYGEGHNDIWKQACIKIGADPERTTDLTNYKRYQAYYSKYVSAPCGCGKVYYKNRLSTRYNYSCRGCGETLLFKKNY